ncbi:uncharacterized protein A4U43_C05F22390 [Asparagus officinalis]|uniref:Uncharacterized protein n=1 Tax=Asparagus officinalis TaxID=4686 RepID=A0A5P1EUZ9_ASPOF|nr:uncharacterized protein A4U43_C05F22390 [Asparagus officinalis]
MPTTQSPGSRQLSRTNRHRTERAAPRISENYPNLAVSLECGSSLMRWDHVRRISASFRGTFFGSRGRKEVSLGNVAGRGGDVVLRDADGRKRCGWVTEFSDEVYVSFHDKCWGVPVFHDSQLFEQLTLSGMLIDFNWTQILKRREWYREVFAKFDPNVVAKMDEKDIIKITSKKKFGLAKSRVRCIIDNAKCVQKASIWISHKMELK